MQKLRIGGVIILRDGPECSAEPLWISLALSSQRNFRNTQILLLNTWKPTLERRYPVLGSSSITVKEIECLEDALQSELICGENGEQLNTACFLDSVNSMFLSSPVECVCRSLQRLSHRGAVVVRLNGDVCAETQFRRLRSIADSVLTLSVGHNDTSVCELISFKKNGKRFSSKEVFTVDSSLCLRTSAYVERSNFLQDNLKENSRWEFDNTSFNMGLKLMEDERRAKEALKLPFVAAQSQEGLLGVTASGRRKVCAGGRVIYTPDDADDLDDSDPDDDLQI